MSEQLLRGNEVASRLGVSSATAYRWMKLGVLPVVRVSGIRSVRVPESGLENWIKRNTASNPMKTASVNSRPSEESPLGRSRSRKASRK